MKTLKAFWHWVDNEGHADWALALEKMRHALSWTAQEALELAARSIARRLVVTGDEPLACLDVVDHRGALRELSLAFCEAIERMHEQVEAPTWEQKRARIVEQTDAHIAEWVERMYRKPDRVLEAFDKGEALLMPSPEFAEAMEDPRFITSGPLETFKGVDRGDPPRPTLSGVRVPSSLRLDLSLPANWPTWIALSPESRGSYAFGTLNGEAAVGAPFELDSRVGTMVAVDRVKSRVLVDFASQSQRDTLDAYERRNIEAARRWYQSESDWLNERATRPVAALRLLREQNRITAQEGQWEHRGLALPRGSYVEDLRVARRRRRAALHVFGPSQALQASTVVSTFKHPPDVAVTYAVVLERDSPDMARGLELGALYLHASVTEVDNETLDYAVKQCFLPGLTDREAVFVVTPGELDEGSVRDDEKLLGFDAQVHRAQVALDALREKTARDRERLNRGELDQELLEEAFTNAHEAIQSCAKRQVADNELRDSLREKARNLYTKGLIGPAELEDIDQAISEAGTDSPTSNDGRQYSTQAIPVNTAPRRAIGVDVGESPGEGAIVIHTADGPVRVINLKPGESIELGEGILR